MSDRDDRMRSGIHGDCDWCRWCGRLVYWFDTEVMDEVYLEGWVHWRYERDGPAPIHWLSKRCQGRDLRLKDARWRG